MNRILIVDDEASIRLLYSQELIDEGYTVDAAGTIAEALALLKENSYAVVLLDIKLKNESGLDLLQSLVQGAPRYGRHPFYGVFLLQG